MSQDYPQLNAREPRLVKCVFEKSKIFHIQWATQQQTLNLFGFETNVLEHRKT